MQIHELSATELRASLDAGELSSVDIVRALTTRMDQVEPKVRAFVHRFDDQALDAARRADQARARGDELPPLHGLPLSLKENIATVGLPQTMGIKARLDRPATEDAAVVTALDQAGLIPLGKTNVPLLMLAMETHNDIWGTTHNPWDLGRAPGGSSGGEGAAIASGSSPWGIGTDIGGSIRIPAAWCGIVGLKPGNGRWSMRGIASGIPGQEVVRASLGPMARTVADVVLLMETLTAPQQALDPRLAPVPWTSPSEVDLGGLRVGVYEDDGVVRPAASVRRAVRQAAAALEAAGCEVVPFTPPPAWDLVELYFGGVSADGSQTAKARCEGQGPTPQLATLFRVARLPGPVRKLVVTALRARGEQRAARQLEAFGDKPVAELFALNARRTALQRRELDAWAAAGLDAVVCASTLTPPALLGETHDWSLGAWHTMRSNILDLPAGVVPVTRVRQDEQVRADLADRIDRKAALFERDSAGLPVSAQVLGKPWQEHVVLALMAAIEAEARRDPEYPATPVDP